MSMRISNPINSYTNITSLFSTLSQGKTALFASQLANSKFLFPENLAPGKGLSNDSVSYINDIKKASGDLSNSLKELSWSAFNQKSLVSSNTDAMAVNYSGTSQSMSSIADMKVKIDQIATGQLNEGAALQSKGTYGGDRGVNRFSVEIGGKTTQLSISVSVTDDNKAVQDKMAKAINDAGLGLKASVETDSKTGVSMLRVESEKTGSDAKNAFTIKDVTGNAVASTGANDMTSSGQDAIYSVNGGAAKTSASNTVNLGNGVSVTFKAASDEEITISKGKDAAGAINAVKDMVSSYNKLFGAAAENVGDPKAQSLASRLVSTSNIYSKSLSDIGIGFDSSGRMTIDSEKMNKAAEDGTLERFFTQDRGKNFGFANQLGRIADNVKSNTSAYVSNNLFGSDNNIFNYSMYGNTTLMNNMYAGSMFEFLF